MKSIFEKLQYWLMLLIVFVANPSLYAQEGEESTTSTTSTTKTEISLTENTGEWYTSPWVWIVGAALFILLLVALLSNRGTDRDRVIVKKTVDRRDSDVV